MNKYKFRKFAAQQGSFKAQGNTLILDGVIGDWWDETTSKSINQTIRAMEGDITVFINSPGGSVFDGISIMNTLRQHEGKITVIIDGLAASIASVIAVGVADKGKLVMRKGSMMMIHDPFTITCGNAAELRKTAETLDTLTANIAKIYADKSGKSLDDIKAAMNDETWFTAAGALEYGLIDEAEAIESEADIKNFDLSFFNNVPEDLRQRIKGIKPGTIREFESLLRDAGFSRSEARAVASGGFSVLEQRDAVKSEESTAAILEAVKNRSKIFEIGGKNND